MVGSRILVLSPHPGRVKAELNAHQFGHSEQGGRTSRRSHQQHPRHAVRRQGAIEEARRLRHGCIARASTARRRCAGNSRTRTSERRR